MKEKIESQVKVKLINKLSKFYRFKIFSPHYATSQKNSSPNFTFFIPLFKTEKRQCQDVSPKIMSSFCQKEAKVVVPIYKVYILNIYNYFPFLLFSLSAG